MQLKIQRSQRTGGVLSNTVFFCLDVRADYSPEEQSNISKYKLGGQVIYNSQSARKHLDRADAHLGRVDSDSMKEKAAGLARGAFSMAMAKMSLNISIDSLSRGQHIECKDLEELLEAEETVRTACKNVTRYLEAAATFDGSETVSGSNDRVATQYDANERVLQTSRPYYTATDTPRFTSYTYDDLGRVSYEHTNEHAGPIQNTGTSVRATCLLAVPLIGAAASSLFCRSIPRTPARYQH